MNHKIFALVLIVFITFISRFVPHPPNFTPILAAGLFAGTYFNKKYLAYIIPISIMIATDLIIGIHATLVWVYLSILLVVLLGTIIAKKKNILTVGLGGIGGAVLFFILTNFGVWITGGGYSHPLTFGGLIACYIDAIPFFKNTLLSTMGYYSIMYLSYEKYINPYLENKYENSEKLAS
ncbi:MAG: hypothetical protein HN729_01055 [Candidatus Marinimicrobia bacterium]|jgi:hypothetical protein|nr:hypothetical protein [Candidatus Neomarinimicrobiota bacterium]MBT3633337.1 hypothetical protein [Candidatus Neomarinimicrobiota bacterium]MBT3681480.1 hypothetical protein [Candidatus Neomarinimicrobiota bacterium]MBT3758553.1 hypothetical protein [Candidatus Neomarinimicrobiota bacterium]MBT3894793.1 hypothetical protein [Candidatus Neomarinimicrobiota bacterium]